MKKTRLYALMLVSAMLAVSCGESSAGSETTAPDTDNEVSGSDETTSLFESDSLPKLDFNGEDFTIFVEDYGGYCGVDFFVDEANGDIVNDATFEKNRAVAERLNLNILWKQQTHDWSSRDEYTNHVRSTVLAGDGEYDILAGLGYFVPSFVPDNILADMSELPYIDIDKPWWSKNFMENASVDGKYYFVTGDASLGLIKNMFCIFENLPLAEEMKLAEDPYELVKSGKWTLDKFTTLIKDCYADLNGNTEADGEDRFGLLINSANHATGFIEPFNVDIVAFEGDKGKIVFGNEHNVDVVQKLCSVIADNESIFYDRSGEQETAYKSIFRNRNVVFATGWLMHTDSYRDLNFDYGVLPYPKYDETQSEYKTTVLTTYSVLSIPADCKDYDRSAAVIEALGSESYRTVTPAYFETALKVKYARDNESAQMFDIIRNGIDFDFGYIYTLAMGAISGNFCDNIVANRSDWASIVAGMQDSKQELLDKLIDAIRKVGETE